ncbi:MAG: hypothetical protein R6U64_02785 [Bacteroidales bacterium]
MNLLLKVKTYEEYEDSTKYGELFYVSLVNDFREQLPPAMRKYRFSDQHPSLKQAQIIVFGDSHFDHSRSVSLPERLARQTGKNVYYHRINKPFWGNALAFLETNGVQPQQKRLFVYGTTERYIPERFMVPYHPQVIDSKVKPHRYLLDQVLFPENAEFLYATVMKRSYLTHNLYTHLSTLRFRLFKYINSFTPVYHIDPQNGSWLFTSETVNHFHHQYTDEQIDVFATNISHLANMIKQKYNMDFLFLPVPERYSIYYDLTGEEEYHHFLTRLYIKLDKYNVAYIPLYDDYKNSDVLLYHKTDTHWNTHGVHIALEKTLEAINGRYFSNNIQLSGESENE